MISFFRKDSKDSEEDRPTDLKNRGMVLVVDDSPTETYILKNFLEKAGYSVATAADGQQGVAKAREIKPLFILMDVVMPVLNGFQATRQLGNDPETKAIPVIMVTTKDQETDKSWGMKQGASAYLVKPITERDLMAAIKGLKLP